jgi:hypothetical protein
MVAGAGLLGASAMPAAAQDLVYGASHTELRLVNPNSPASTTLVGSLGLPAGYLMVNMAYHPTQDSLYAIIFGAFSGGFYDQYFYQINRANGTATQVANLGNAGSVGYYEALEYVNSLNTLVASRAQAAGSTVTDQLFAV